MWIFGGWFFLSKRRWWYEIQLSLGQWLRLGDNSGGSIDTDGWTRQYGAPWQIDFLKVGRSLVLGITLCFVPLRCSLRGCSLDSFKNICLKQLLQHKQNLLLHSSIYHKKLNRSIFTRCKPNFQTKFRPRNANVVIILFFYNKSCKGHTHVTWIYLMCIFLFYL